MQQQTPEPRKLSEIDHAISTGSVIMLQRLNYGDTPCYMVLRQQGPASFCTHFYNGDRDAFEFGTYHTDSHAAHISYHARIAEYNGK